MPYDPSVLPGQRVENRECVGNLTLDGKRSLQRRRLEPALLIRGDLKAGPDLLGEPVEIFERHARAAMEQQHTRTLIPAQPPVKRPAWNLRRKR